MQIVHVERVTPQRLVIGGIHYRKRDARAIGDHYIGSSLYVLCEKEIAAGKVLLRRHNLASVKWKDLTDEQINRVAVIVWGNKSNEEK